MQETPDEENINSSNENTSTDVVVYEEKSVAKMADQEENKPKVVRLSAPPYPNYVVVNGYYYEVHRDIDGSSYIDVPIPHHAEKLKQRHGGDLHREVTK